MITYVAEFSEMTQKNMLCLSVPDTIQIDGE